MKFIVTSTINQPSRAIRLFDAMEDWKVIVVGDLKTPTDYKLNRGIYLSPADQREYDRPLSDAIGWNKYPRLNIGLLMAYEMGAEVVALINDDNIPYDSWGMALMLEKLTPVNYFETTLPVFDPVGATDQDHLWHRGYPLELLSQRDYLSRSLKLITPQIQADFWNGDPDTDAIARLMYKPNCTFNDDEFPIASNAISPFNCQNTFITRDVLKNYFLFPNLGRMDDIWASYYVQAKGFKVVYGAPSVFHDRDPHDLIQDMKAEYLGNEVGARIVKDLTADPRNIARYVPEDSMLAFQLYKRHF